MALYFFFFFALGNGEKELCEFFFLFFTPDDFMRAMAGSLSASLPSFIMSIFLTFVPWGPFFGELGAVFSPRFVPEDLYIKRKTFPTSLLIFVHTVFFPPK